MSGNQSDNPSQQLQPGLAHTSQPGALLLAHLPPENATDCKRNILYFSTRISAQYSKCHHRWSLCSGPCVVMSQIPWLLLLSCSSCNWGSCCHLEWRKRITAVSGLFVPAPVILPSVGSSHSVITAYYQISSPGHTAQ